MSKVTMEKPRKKVCSNHSLNDNNFSDPEESCLECYVNREVNAHHDAMSTWLEGAVPSEEEITDTIKMVSLISISIDDERRLIAQAIHSMLLRKLTGEV